MGKKLTLLFMVCAMLFGGTAKIQAYEAQLVLFRDLPASDWAAESVYKLLSLGIVAGYENGTFRPGDELTREAFVKMLVETVAPVAVEKKAQAAVDVTSSRWSYPYIKQAGDAGWLDFLLKEGAFNPAAGINREEVAVLTAKALMQSETDEETRLWLQSQWTDQWESAAFLDKDEVDQQLAPLLLKTVSAGIMMGDNQGKFRPSSTLTRREAAAIIDRMIAWRTNDYSLEIASYYSAGGPYKNTARFGNASEVIFDWAELDYEVDGTASVSMKLPSDWRAVMEAADQQQAMKTLMVFANTSQHRLQDFLLDDAARLAFVGSLSEVLAEPSYSFTAVNIDFEGLTETSQAGPFTKLLTEVNAAVGSGVQLTVAVPPTYYYKGYDYKEIGKLADRVVLMAHDFTHRESFLPSAPLPLVGETVREALQHIPADKLLLGISKQANQWTTKQDGTIEFYPSPAIAAVESRVANADTTSEIALPYYLNRITFKDDRGEHVVWYENAESIEIKLQFAQAFGLRGVSLWQMNQMTDEDWEVVGQYSSRK